MRKSGFTLLELMVTVLLGSIVLLTIAGCLRGTIRAWESAQNRISENYHRRNVIDLLKRQTTSLFLRADAGQISFNSNAINARRGRRQTVEQQRARQAIDNRAGFGLPEGTSFFTGSPQELSFLSNISYLSDFPGQVAVRYYVKQGTPEEGASAGVIESSGFSGFSDLMFSPDEIPSTLEGDLYLYLEEKNLFLSSINERLEGGVTSMPDPSLGGGQALAGGAQAPLPDPSTAITGEILDTRSTLLIGPLRQFSINYRVPGQHQADDFDSEENWSPIWDLDTEGRYPSAVEFILIFEKEGVSENVATEDLPGIRMVIPIFDAANLARGRNRERSF